MPAPTEQDYLDASVDLQSLEQIVNGAADRVNPGHAAGTVTTRLGLVIKTIANVIAAISANIGLSRDWAAKTTDTDVDAAYPGQRSSFWNAGLSQAARDAAELFKNQAQTYAAAVSPKRLNVITDVVNIGGRDYGVAITGEDRAIHVLVDLVTQELKYAGSPEVYSASRMIQRGHMTDWTQEMRFEPIVVDYGGDGIIGVHHESGRLASAVPLIVERETAMVDRATAAFTWPDYGLSLGFGQSNSRGSTFRRLMTTAAQWIGIALKFGEGVAPDVPVANAGVANPASPTQFNLGFVDMISDTHVGDATSFGAEYEGATPTAVNQLVKLILQNGDKTATTIGKIVGSTAGFGSMSIQVLTSANGGTLNRWKRVINHLNSFFAQVPGGKTAAALIMRWHQLEANQDTLIGSGTPAIVVSDYRTQLNLLRTDWRTESLARNTTASPQAAPIAAWVPCYRNILPAGTNDRICLEYPRWADANPDDVFLVGPDYQFDYSNDEFHQDDEGKARMGALEAVVQYFAIVKNKRWQPLRATTAWVQGDLLYLRLNPMFGPVQVRKIRGTLFQNYGLRITDDTGDLTLSDPFRVDWRTLGFHLDRTFNKATGSVVPLRIGIDYGRPVNQFRIKNASGNVEMGGTNICDSMTLADIVINGELRSNPNFLIPSIIDCSITVKGI